MTKAKRISTKELNTIYDYLPSRGMFNNATIQAILMRVRPDATKNQIEGIPEPMIKRRLIERVSNNRFKKILELPEPLQKQNLLNLSESEPSIIEERVDRWRDALLKEMNRSESGQYGAGRLENWQRFLRERGLGEADENPKTIDDFEPSAPTLRQHCAEIPHGEIIGIAERLSGAGYNVEISRPDGSFFFKIHR